MSSLVLSRRIDFDATQINIEWAILESNQ